MCVYVQKNVLAMLSGLFVDLNVHILRGFTLDNVSQYIFLSHLIFWKVYFTALLAFQEIHRPIALLIDVFHLGVHSETYYTLCHTGCF